MSHFFIDTHCHLNLGHLKDNPEVYIDKSNKAGVKYLHTICTRIEDFDEILSISDKHQNVYCSVGIHPCNVSEETILSEEELCHLSSHPKVISYGETGLDYYHTPFDADLQKKSFINHINAARLTNLPIIVHTRRASEDTLEVLSSEMKNGEFTGIIHCFTENLEFAKKALDLGFYISIAGIVTFKNASELQGVVRHIPLDKLLIETDAPYLAPMPMRGKPNEPSYVKYTAEFLANMLNLGIDEIAQITSQNAAK
ncbi:MAG: TatD family hydrolase, partial [Rickettsiaceae bacterium]|nr:TatD family hydrolase [Rickettsiaceae bacterium]